MGHCAQLRVSVWPPCWGPWQVAAPACQALSCRHGRSIEHGSVMCTQPTRHPQPAHACRTRIHAQRNPAHTLLPTLGAWALTTGLEWLGLPKCPSAPCPPTDHRRLPLGALAAPRRTPRWAPEAPSSMFLLCAALLSPAAWHPEGDAAIHMGHLHVGQSDEEEVCLLGSTCAVHRGTLYAAPHVPCPCRPCRRLSTCGGLPDRSH